MQTLFSPHRGALLVVPRRPYRTVMVSDRAYDGLLRAQNLLHSRDIRLVVTRGLENQGRMLAVLHFMARAMGVVAFCLLYLRRIREAGSIFCANGHTEGGDCVDVSIMYGQQRLNFLPWGVLTTTACRDRLYRQNQDVVEAVWDVLRRSGFSIHANPTEALQIHCEYKA